MIPIQEQLLRVAGECERLAAESILRREYDAAGEMLGQAARTYKKIRADVRGFGDESYRQTADCRLAAVHKAQKAFERFKIVPDDYEYELDWRKERREAYDECVGTVGCGSEHSAARIRLETAEMSLAEQEARERARGELHVYTQRILGTTGAETGKSSS